MKQNKKEIISGILLSVMLMSLLAFVHSRSVVKDSGEKFVLYAYFSKADGLMNGADVRLGGIKVGSVTHQSLNGRYAVRVRMSFDNPIELSTDTSVAIETDGLLGSKHIEIVPGGDEEILASGDDISYTQDALILSELMDKVMVYMREKKNQPEPICAPCETQTENGEE